ncbi:MAG: hypothetical protein ACI959_000201 [Limisphaerales bacterium]|jgi:hypothetical protein
MSKHIFILSFILFSAFNIATAQLSTSTTFANTRGDISVIVSPHVDYMVQRHQQLNQRGGVLAGYRIQVFASAVMSQVQSKRAGFYSRFPKFSTEIVLEEPDFKLVFGNYVDRFDAWRDLQLVLKKYPGSFIRQDLIRVSKL